MLTCFFPNMWILCPRGFSPLSRHPPGNGHKQKTIPTDGKGESKGKAAVIWADNFTTLVKNWEIWIAFGRSISIECGDLKGEAACAADRVGRPCLYFPASFGGQNNHMFTICFKYLQNRKRGSILKVRIYFGKRAQFAVTSCKKRVQLKIRQISIPYMAPKQILLPLSRIPHPLLPLPSSFLFFADY